VATRGGAHFASKLCIICFDDSAGTISAAIYGLRGKENVSIFILHPKGRVSPVQEAQMTTVTDSNVCNIAVKGTFDSCQVSSARDRRDERTTIAIIVFLFL
jgi:threonine synthase